jgi:hypothetical protein
LHAIQRRWRSRSGRRTPIDKYRGRKIDKSGILDPLHPIAIFGEHPAVAAMEGVFARAAQRWFERPKVVTGFINFVVQPAAARLLLHAIKWLADTVPSFDSSDWRYGLEENLISFLHACWDREKRRISNDPSLQGAFLSLLRCVVSRGGHAAIALRDRVVNSAAG